MNSPGTEQGTPVLDAQNFVRLVRIHWRAIALITVLCTLLALAWTLIQPRIYSATATGLVVTTGAQDLTGALAGENLEKSKANSYKSLARSRPVSEAVIAELGLDTTPEQLPERITTEVPVSTAEVQITADAKDPGEAADLANTWITALAEQVEELENATGNGGANHRVILQSLSSANPPLEPSSPTLSRNLIAGALGGLVIGLLYAVTRYKMDNSSDLRTIHA